MVRKIVNLPLPGDVETFLAADLSRAIRRDGRLNFEERRALSKSWWCAEASLKYDFWKCNFLTSPCVFCAELD